MKTLRQIAGFCDGKKSAKSPVMTLEAKHPSFSLPLSSLFAFSKIKGKRHHLLYPDETLGVGDLALEFLYYLAPMRFCTFAPSIL